MLVVLKVAFTMGVKAADTTSPAAVAGKVAASSYLRLEFAVPDAQLGPLVSWSRWSFVDMVHPRGGRDESEPLGADES